LLIYSSITSNITVWEYFGSNMKSKDIGQLIKQTRKRLRITQKDLALTSNTGLRFIIELEQGKPTCQLEKTLTVLQTLGIKIVLNIPSALEGKRSRNPIF